MIFALYHIYDRTIDGIISREIKRTGFFGSRRRCIEIIEIFKEYKGFRDYPETCFKKFEYEIGEEYWRNEFLA